MDDDEMMHLGYLYPNESGEELWRYNSPQSSINYQPMENPAGAFFENNRLDYENEKYKFLDETFDDYDGGSLFGSSNDSNPSHSFFGNEQGADLNSPSLTSNNEPKPKETEDEDNKLLDISNIRIKYKKVRCCKCKKNNTKRIDCFVLDRGKKSVASNVSNDELSFICFGCSKLIDNIHKLSDWEDEPELIPKYCYRCKRDKSSYRFNSNYCSYCSNKMKYRNIRKSY